MSPWPVDWTERTLGSFAEARGGTGFPMAFQGRDFGQLPFYKVSDMNLDGNATWMHRANNYISIAELRELGGKPFDAKTIVFPKVGATIYTNKKRILAGVAIVDNNVMGVTVTDRESCSPDFLYFWFLHIDLATLSSPGTVPSITSARVKEQTVRLPPRGEQRQIAAVLSLVQRAIEQQKRLIALTAELKKALIHKLFTEGTRGEALKQTAIGPVPQSWEIVPLGSIAKIGNGSTPKRDNVAYWKDGTIPWLTSGKIHEGRIRQPDQYVTETAKAECHLPLVAGGSLLVAITGEGKTLGNAAIVEFDTCVSQHLAYVQFQQPDVLPAFLLYFFQRQYAHLRQMSVGAGSTKKALTCGLLKRYGVPMAPKGEQELIASALDAVVAKLKAHEHIAGSLRALFRTLLDQLMTGQIRVHDLDLSKLEGAGRVTAEVPLIPDREDIFAEIRPDMVDIEDLDDAREAIYTREEADAF